MGLSRGGVMIMAVKACGVDPCGWQIFAVGGKKDRKPMVKPPHISWENLYIYIYICVFFGRFSLKPIHGFEISSISQTSGQHPYWRLTSAGFSFFSRGWVNHHWFQPNLSITCQASQANTPATLSCPPLKCLLVHNSHSLVRPTVDGCEILHQFIGGLSHC